MEETIQDIGVEEADKNLKICKKYETLIRNKKIASRKMPARKIFTTNIPIIFEK